MTSASVDESKADLIAAPLGKEAGRPFWSEARCSRDALMSKETQQLFNLIGCVILVGILVWASLVVILWRLASSWWR